VILTRNLRGEVAEYAPTRKKERRKSVHLPCPMIVQSPMGYNVLRAEMVEEII
jgi:hypothetical protein